MTKKTDYSTDIDTSIDLDGLDDVSPFHAEPKAAPIAAEPVAVQDDKTVTTLESGIKVEHINEPVKVIQRLKIKDIHELTGISERTLSQYFKYGVIKGNKQGKCWFATPDAVTAYMNGEYDRTAYVEAMKPTWTKLNARQKEKRHQLKAEQAALATADGIQG